jgi:cytochrome c-type biogenesis protein CcmH/NrfF
MPRSPRVARREALKLGLAGLLPLGLPQEPEAQDRGEAAPRLYDPFRAGRAQDRITDYENDPFIIEVESRLRCTCGCNLDVYTCRTTDFTCGTSPAMHREVVALVEAGKTGEEILEAFVAQHGELVLMAPKKEGFNLAAYFVPGAAILTAGGLLVWALARRGGRMQAVQSAEGMDLSGLGDEDREKLEAELQNLEL